MAKKTLIVQDTPITVIKRGEEDYIYLTDMLQAKDGDFFVTDWLRNRNTLEYIGIWEKVYNPDFNYGEFATIRNQAGLNSFKISVKEFVSRTNAISLQAKAGRYGGTYAHKDIAFEFAMWISPEFKIFIVKEFQRLKEEEQKAIGWSAKRELSKINYHIHTDAVRANLVPDEVDAYHSSLIYAEEADVLNVALFGITAKEWRDANPDKKGNMRDYATINQLICLSNMEYPEREPNTFENRNNTVRNLNAVFINEGIPQRDRLHKLNKIAIQQMTVLEDVGNRKLLK
ncbi:MAG: KilA-N domain-containing protein [Bacteroidales bacterium]|nr:KilA-N domain-containing protein [Bacteroidales bacterium]